MILNTIGCLVLVGVLGFFKLKMRYDRIVSWLMFFVLLFLFWDYTKQALVDNNASFSFLWNSTKKGDITIDFYPLLANNRLIVPMFFISVMSVFNNNIFRYEEKKTSFNALIILNLVSLCLLICSKNYVQLITTIFVSDVLGYLLIKDVDSSRRFVIYNLFADMCLFMVLSLVCGKVHSLELSQLFNYQQIGRHKDFVGIITTIALCIKMGCIPFHSYLLDLSKARFQRMSAINMLFAPLVGVLVLQKLHNLINVSDLSIPLLKIISIISMIGGVLGSIIQNSIQKKLIYLNMSYFGFQIWFLLENNFSWLLLTSYSYIALYLFNLLFFKIYLYQNRESLVSEMLNSSEINPILLKTILVQMIFLTNVFLGIIWQLTLQIENIYFMIFGYGIILSIAIILNHIYNSPRSRRLEYLTPNRLRVLSFILVTTILIWSTARLGLYKWQNIIFVLTLWGIIYTPLITKLRILYKKNWLQHKDLSRRFFSYTLAIPFMHISRSLWLMIDFVFSEKVITSFLGAINRGVIFLFFKINRKNWFTVVFFIVLGILSFVLSFYKGIKI